MQHAPIPENEHERLVSLYKLGLLDTPPEERFDRITRLATAIFRVPISTLTLINGKREWFKSCQGLSKREGDRAISFCGHALTEENILVVPDTKKDKRFFDNPMVQDVPFVRFYAGVPVKSADGNRVGVLCVKDTKPRSFSPAEEQILKGLAGWAEVELNSRNLSLALASERRLQLELEAQEKERERLNNAQKDIHRALVNVLDDLEMTRATIEREKARDEAMLASIGEGLFAVDIHGKALMMNNAAEKILGWKKKDVLGAKITDLPLADENGNFLPPHKRPIFLALHKGYSITTTHYFVRKNKTQFPISITVTPIKLGKDILGVIVIFRDISYEMAVDKAKSEFVSLASHQLRTPLGIMKWYLEALDNDAFFRKAPTNIQKYFHEIYRSNERVLNLVRELLSVSRIEQGHVRNTPKAVDPLSVIRDIVRQVQGIARRKKVTLRVRANPRTVPKIYIDSLRFYEVIENLIMNAIEYTSTPGGVDVMVKRTGATLCISVHDTGMGIPLDDQQKLFTKFFRSERAIQQNPEGSGLGLYVVKSYAEGWGGSVSLDSTEGKGSTFTIRLPIEQKKKNRKGVEQ